MCCHPCLRLFLLLLSPSTFRSSVLLSSVLQSAMCHCLWQQLVPTIVFLDTCVHLIPELSRAFVVRSSQHHRLPAHEGDPESSTAAAARVRHTHLALSIACWGNNGAQA